MANTQGLEASVAKAADRVERCKATISRHETQKAKKLEALAKRGVDISNLEDAKRKARDNDDRELAWAIYEAGNKDDDIIGATHKLKEAETILSKWQTKLNVELEKERFLSENAPAVIIDFLNQWKEKAREWYIKAHVRYLELRVELQAAKDDAEDRFIAEYPTGRKWGRDYDKFMKSDEEIKRIAGAIAMMGGAVATMATYRIEQNRLAWLESMLEDDRKAKLFDLINRINAVVGTITDATRLRVNEKGNLDGILIGENGKAKIETIGAGGYNIQVFHYRTLVHKLEGK